jgi:uncharacterized protein YkwD
MPNSWVQNFAQKVKKPALKNNSTLTPKISTPSSTPYSPSLPPTKPMTPTPRIGGGSDGKVETDKGATDINVSSPDASTPAPGAPYMSILEWSMLEEINLLRGNPTGYVKYIEEYKNSERAKGKGLSETTVNELIQELRSSPKLSILKPSECVYSAAQRHGRDIKQRGKSGHVGSDGSWPWDRVRKSCIGWQDGNENIVNGHDEVRHAVITLLIDEGLSNRGHRKTLLNPKWTHAACYKVGTIGNMPNYWVQNFGQR